jgi:hypothetical protein
MSHVEPVTLETLAQRLVALERQNRRLKQGFAGALVIVAVIFAAAGTKAQVAPTTVAADRLAMVDEQGRTRATIENSPAMPQGNPLLTFFDRSGKPRLRIGLGARGAMFETLDENGRSKDFFGPPFARPLTQ